MALQITKEQSNTSVATYFIATKVMIDKLTSKAQVVVSGYADKAARDSNPTFPILTKGFEVQLTDILTNVYPEVYEKLLTAKENSYLSSTVPYFEGALSV